MGEFAILYLLVGFGFYGGYKHVGPFWKAVYGCHFPFHWLLLTWIAKARQDNRWILAPGLAGFGLLIAFSSGDFILPGMVFIPLTLAALGKKG